MFPLVLLIVTISVYAKTVSSQVEPESPIGTFVACNNFFGTKGDISDCSLYYRCTFGQLIQHQCLSPFHFNKISQSCDFIDHAGCTVGDPEQGQEPPTFGPCNNFFGSKGDISDCSIYYRCTLGQWVRSQCLSPFHWNKISQSCDFIDHAGCKVGDPEQAKEPPTFGPCRNFFGSKGDISDCSIYYRCRLGTWVRDQCLSPFHWNKVSQSCDFIRHAGCRVGDPEQAKEQPTFGSCRGFGSTGDLKSCDIYYQCVNGQWNRRQCLSGFHWNQIARRCDFISSAGCNKTL